MRTGITRTTLLALGATLLILFGIPPARGDLIPFTNGEQDTVYAHYDNFLRCRGQYPGPFTAADRGTFFADLFDTHLWELTGQGFLTGGGNIYSPTAATNFAVVVPNYGRSQTGGQWTTYVFVQVRTLGSELDYAGLNLSYEDPTGLRTQTWADAVLTLELLREPNPIGGDTVETLVVFAVPYNPGWFLVNFFAAESSMSLDQFRVDTAAVGR